jgi:DNA-binding NarL/FixJ family response regulator
MFELLSTVPVPCSGFLSGRKVNWPSVNNMAHLTAVIHHDRIRVLAADSSSMSTQLLVEALARDSNLHMIESPSDGAGVLNALKRDKPHVAVVSAALDETNGGSFELVREIRVQVPNTRVIILLDSSDRHSVVEAFRAGAQGVFCRTEPVRHLSKCIQCVHQGQVWASSTEFQFVLDALAKPPLADFRAKSGSLLSAREIDVVRCVAEGLSNREIAQRLKLTEHTVKNYLFRIFDKLGVSSRVEVVLYALGSNGRSTPAPPARRQTPVALATKPAAPSPVTIRKTAT